MKRIAFSVILFLSCVLSALAGQHAQDTAAWQKLRSFVSNVNAFTDSYPQEKAYLHFDNSSYFQSETMWFKAYIVTAAKHEATDVSRTLYVELLSPEGNVAATRKLLIENGQCHGEFPLPAASYYSGFYQVRAYTRYMLNFGDDCVFSRVFPVYEQPDRDGDYSKKLLKGNRLSIPNKRVSVEKLDNPNIVFFPEGGSLVRGLESKVAFKATDRDGMSVEVTGTVYNSKKEVVTTFQSQHTGMGFFHLTPTEERYYAEVRTSSGKKAKIDLPAVQQGGHVITLKQTENEIQASIRRNGDTLAELVALASSCRGEVNSFAVVDMTGTERALVKIPTEKNGNRH